MPYIITPRYATVWLYFWLFHGSIHYIVYYLFLLLLFYHIIAAHCWLHYRFMPLVITIICLLLHNAAVEPRLLQQVQNGCHGYYDYYIYIR